MRYAPLIAAFAFAACDSPGVELQTVRPPDQMPSKQPPPTEFQPQGNHAPQAALRLKDLAADLTVGSEILLDASETFDADGDALTYSWSTNIGELNAGGTAGSLVVNTAGMAAITLFVKDIYGASDQTTLKIWILAKETPPAADGGGFSGVCPLPMPSWHYDAINDVTLPGADIIATAGAISGGQVDLRVQFCDTPFPQTATHTLTFCLDSDANLATGACGVGSSANLAFDLSSVPGKPLSMNLGATVINACQAVSWDPGNRVLRILLPLSALFGATTFQYKVGSIFGGSFGANDWSPVGQLGGPMWGLSSELPAFSGVSICTVRP